ncbi:hypothetical protein Fmac_032417 [Flemingia macrophylla]|uniref:26S proteasome non-ATPase regulatory subunit 2 homolog n=1 Tax=Flemingia macrophylla TaxID=520843 RepID=A0ABD1L4X4_9FABA
MDAAAARRSEYSSFFLCRFTLRLLGFLSISLSVPIPSLFVSHGESEDQEPIPDEDLALKQRLELCLERTRDPDLGLQKKAIQIIRQEIITSTSSMTSVPMPLMFLCPHYNTLKAYYHTMVESDLKKYMADIISVLAFIIEDKRRRESLKYRLLGSQGDIGIWGNEYVRNLAGEIKNEHWIRTVENFDMLKEHVEKTNFKRTCVYLTSLTRYLYGPDETMPALALTCWIYQKFEDYPHALQIALFLDNLQYVRHVFTSCNDLLQKKQLCYILARHGTTFELDNEMAANEEDREMLQDIINNSKLSEGYLTLARDIEVMEPKSPADIYKAHLFDGRKLAGASLDSAKQNLAVTFVNAFVNAGFGQDNLMTVTTDSSSSARKCLVKNKKHGKTSAVASLGMILLWDIDSGLAQLDKYLNSDDSHVIAGALLGVGIVHCSIKHDCHPAMALLGDYLNEKDTSIRISAIMGLGIAYAGSQNKQLRDKLVPILSDSTASLDVIAFTTISLGLIYVSSCNEEVAQAIISSLKNRSESELENPLTRLLPLGLGLLFLGKSETVDPTLQGSGTFNEKIRVCCHWTIFSCAYAGTGDIFAVQELLKYLELDRMPEGFAVLGIAMIAMAEEIGLEMQIRIMEQFLHFGEQNSRRAVPLALGLLCISNPKVNVMDTLSRLSHDTDSEVAMAAVISLGMIGAGTNNGRIARILFDLASYYCRDASLMFCVRIAQGLVHLGKGLLTLNPYHSDRFLLSPTALAGVIIVLEAWLHLKDIVFGKYHYVLYFLVLAMQPRMLLTVDANLNPLSVPVWVGKAVDVVAQAGRPKTITGFHTLSTPVILAAGERAELATEKYIPLSSILEGRGGGAIRSDAVAAKTRLGRRPGDDAARLEEWRGRT